MKIVWGQVLLAVVVGGLSGCASLGPPQTPSLELPKPPDDLKAARKGDKVTLTWTIPARTTDRQSLRYLGKTEICRSVENAAGEPALKECGKAVGEAAAPANFVEERKAASGKKIAMKFVDTVDAAMQQATPAGFANYAVEVMNEAKRGAGLSNQARVPLTPTVAPFGGFAARAVGAGVEISWQCPAARGKASGGKYLFRIYRHPEGSAADTKVADLDATDCATGGRSDTTFVDPTIEWEKTYFYRGTVVSVAEAAGKLVEVEGDDSPEVKVFAHDVFPPAVPAGLQAVYSGPGQETFIDLIWAPVTDADLAGYNVYRHEEGGPEVRVNSELVKTPAYRDAAVVAGKSYVYAVTAVDERGNESGKSEAAGEKVPE